MIKKILSFISLSLIATSVFAFTVNFPAGQKNGSFNCTASDVSATVSMDTNGLNANGFCAGNPYVTRNGHIVGMPTTILNQFYFEINKSATREGSVDVNVTSGTVTCSLGHGDSSRNSYGNGQYCVAN